MSKKRFSNWKIIFLLALVSFAVIFFYFFLPKLTQVSYSINTDTKTPIETAIPTETLPTTNPLTGEKIYYLPANVTHIPTPSAVKAIYMTKWVGSNAKSREKLVGIIDRTEINTVVIDVKDSSGKLSFEFVNPEIRKEGSSQNTIKDIGDFIKELHSKNIYVIARVAVFQDAYFAERHPEYALKSKTTGELWKDAAKIHWLDAGSQDVWKYVTAIGAEAYNFGFDEINFDYIRYPSDGALKDIKYPASEGMAKSDVVTSFYKYLHDNIATTGVKISGDIFGLTTTETTDMGIGQLLISAATYFDYIDPMVYPSHYAPGTYGYKNPSTHPYEIVNFSMKKAVERLTAAGIDTQKIRPWLQDFNLLGVKYTAEMVRAQIKATNDNGLQSWMLWSAGNVYTESALEKAQ